MLEERSESAQSGAPPARLTALAEIRDAARRASGKRRVCVAGGADPAAMEACLSSFREGIIDEAALIGDVRTMRVIAETLRWDLAPLELVDTSEESAILGTALERLRDGRADILMKGGIRTGRLLRAVLDRQYGLRTDRILSHVGVFEFRGRLVMLTDCGVNVDPGLARKVDIIHNAVRVARSLGVVEPLVALLAATESIHLQAMPATRDAIVLRRMNERGEVPDCVVEGPLSLDLALVPEAVRAKGIDNPVAGCADILVADDIEMGNVLYKAIAVMQGLPMASVLVGGRVPVVLPSRADSSKNKLYSVALSIHLSRTPAP